MVLHPTKYYKLANFQSIPYSTFSKIFWEHTTYSIRFPYTRRHYQVLEKLAHHFEIELRRVNRMKQVAKKPVEFIKEGKEPKKTQQAQTNSRIMSQARAGNCW